MKEFEPVEIGSRFPPETFLYQGETYFVLGESNKTNLKPIAEDLYDGKQFICNSRNGTLFDAYIYRDHGKSFLLSIKRKGDNKKEKKEKE